MFETKKQYKKNLVEKLRRHQEGKLNDNYDVGFYNGLEVAISTILEKNPDIAYCIFKPEEEPKKDKGRTVYSGKLK